ncbi:hypothetical protein ACTFIV_001769 [Dictyostelium citrinum]
MFFSQIVLSKRGSLGKIWLAGHWDRKLAKNVVFKTNIPKSVKTILNPHSPMALRMTSHLLLGVARIFSKKAKYLLSDCTEAVIKLKGLSKTISKIDLPSEQDHQALLTSGPRQADKPQVYQEVDRFLRNIDIRDLVVDPLYDPNKLEPTEKPDYSEFFGVADEAVLGSVQTPSNEGNNLVFDGTTTVTPQSDRRFKSDELREAEYNTMVSTPDTGLQFGQGKTPKTPDSVKSGIDILISDNQNPLFNYSATTPLPKSQRELMEDAGMVAFDEGMNFPQDGGDQHVDIGMRHDDDYPAYTGPETHDDGDQQQQEQFDENGRPITPAKSATTDKTSEADTTTAAGVATTTATANDGVAIEEKTEFEIQQLQQQLLLEKQKEEQVQKDKPKTRRSRVLGSTLSDKDIRKFKNTRSLTVERSLLPSSLNLVISKSKEIPAKQQMLTAIRKNISNTFHRMYGEILDNRYPKIINKEEDPYFSFLRSRLMYGRMLKNEELLMSMAADGVSSLDLGIPSFEDLEIGDDEAHERKIEESFLKSINNRVITESGNLIAPSERKKLKTQPLTDDDKDLINRLRTEFDDRSKNRKSLFYKPDINQTLRGMGGFGDSSIRDDGEKSIGSPDGSTDFLKRAKDKEEEERLRREEGDMGQHFMHGGDDDHQGIGLGYDQEEPGFVHPGDLGEVPEYSFESAQKPNQPAYHQKEYEEEKKILSQKTANMHSILSDHFEKKETINFLQDIVRPQQIQNPNNTRIVAACYFYELLVLKTKVLVNLEQPENDTETYPDIKISKTSQFGNIEQFTIVKNAD